MLNKLESDLKKVDLEKNLNSLDNSKISNLTESNLKNNNINKDLDIIKKLLFKIYFL